jgi:Trk K+ transport system NAD-binding subunit
MPISKPNRRNKPGVRRYYPLWRLIRANFYDFGLLLRESWIALAGFVVLTLAGTLYLRYVHPSRLGFATALYETLKLVSFQSGINLPGDLLGEALFFLIPLLGLALILQSVLNFGRLLLDKGSRREAWQVALASTYHDHVIVCGLGRVGFRVVTQLIDSGYEPVVVERTWASPFVERAINRKVPVVVGDARELTTLRQAGLPRAHAIIAAIQGDLTNIEIGLTARAARPGMRVILRVFGEELDQNLERAFGPNTAFSSSALATPTYVAAAVSREVDYALKVGEQLLGVTTLTLQPESMLTGFVRAIEEAHGIRVLRQIDADGRMLNPAPLRQLSSGDRVTLLGSLEALESLRLKNVRNSKLRFLQPPALQHFTPEYDTVIVCGLGKVGYRVVQQLARLAPRPRIVVVRLNVGRADFSQRISRLDGVQTVIGDARDPEVLRQAGIERAYTVAALTSDDLLNLQIGLAARGVRADVHVVQRAFSEALAEKLADMFGIRTAYSTSGLASPTLVAAAVLGDITQGFAAAGSLFSADEIGVLAGDALDGRSVESIRDQHGGLVIALRRGETTQILPMLGTALAPGDTVTLLARLEDLARMRVVLGRRGHNT